MQSTARSTNGAAGARAAPSASRALTPGGRSCSRSHAAASASQSSSRTSTRSAGSVPRFDRPSALGPLRCSPAFVFDPAEAAPTERAFSRGESGGEMLSDAAGVPVAAPLSKTPFARRFRTTSGRFSSWSLKSQRPHPFASKKSERRAIPRKPVPEPSSRMVECGNEGRSAGREGSGKWCSRKRYLAR